MVGGRPDCRPPARAKRAAGSSLEIHKKKRPRARPSVRRGLITQKVQLWSASSLRWKYSQLTETPRISLDMGSPPLGCGTRHKRVLSPHQNASAHRHGFACIARVTRTKARTFGIYGNGHGTGP